MRREPGILPPAGLPPAGPSPAGIFRGRLRGVAAGLARARRGSMLPLVAMGITVLAGAGVLAVDAGWLYLQRDRLQQVADASALAGARHLPDAAAARAAALDFAVRVLGEDAALLHPGDIATGAWNEEEQRFVAGAEPAGAMRVEVQRSRARGNEVGTFLARLFGVHAMDLGARAVAERARPACLHVLDADGSRALRVDGNARIAVPECRVQVNSTAGDALSVTGTAGIEAHGICVTGGYGLAGGGSASPTPRTGCAPLPDPLAGAAAPATAGCDWTNRRVKGAEVLAPGVYCGGITVNGGGSATFLPGVYVIRDGPLKVSGNGTLSGAGVGLYLSGRDAELALAGNGRIDLSAAAFGPMAGVVLAAGPDVAQGSVHRIGGGGAMRFEGALHFPRQELVLAGGGAALAPSPFTLVVAWRVRITGGGVLRFGADPDHPLMPPAFRPQTAPRVVR